MPDPRGGGGARGGGLGLGGGRRRNATDERAEPPEGPGSDRATRRKGRRPSFGPRGDGARDAKTTFARDDGVDVASGSRTPTFLAYRILRSIFHRLLSYLVRQTLLAFTFPGSSTFARFPPPSPSPAPDPPLIRYLGAAPICTKSVRQPPASTSATNRATSPLAYSSAFNAVSSRNPFPPPLSSLSSSIRLAAFAHASAASMTSRGVASASRSGVSARG